MNVVAVARKSVLELAREPMLLALAISVPVFFMVMYTLASNTPRLSTHPVLVMNPDPPALGPQAQARGQPLVEALAAERYADGRPAFKIAPAADRNAAEAALKDKTATALLSILPDEAGQLQRYTAGRSDFNGFYPGERLAGNRNRSLPEARRRESGSRAPGRRAAGG